MWQAHSHEISLHAWASHREGLDAFQVRRRGAEELRGVFMAQVRNSEDRFGGEYMVQDSNHMSGINQVTDKANRGNARQAEQSQAGGRQQGSGDHNASSQQG